MPLVFLKENLFYGSITSLTLLGDLPPPTLQRDAGEDEGYSQKFISHLPDAKSPSQT